jgi:required for meiotic nuclear division protein 1
MNPEPELPERFTAKAVLVGRHLELRRLADIEPLAVNPILIPVPGGGQAVLLRSGAVVLFGVAPQEEAAFRKHLAPFVRHPLTREESETLNIIVDPHRPDGIDLPQQSLYLIKADPLRLQVVADILGKSVLLADQEAQVTRAFERVEPLADELQRSGRGARHARDLGRHIGETLLIQHQMVGRGEVGDKPEVLWEQPDLERLFLQLEAEYELRERQLALERKLEVIGRTASTLLDLLQSRRSLRVEWYIVILIVVEIGLTLYELIFRTHPIG